MKKQQQSITNFSNEFLVNIMGELVRLQKGMSQAEVKSILGNPIKIEPCENCLNQKLIFKLNSGRPVSARYAALFFNETLVYVAKLT